MKQQGKIQIGDTIFDGEIEMEITEDFSGIPSRFNDLLREYRNWHYNKSPINPSKTIEGTISPIIDETHQLTEGQP